jgi:hypothetical protein
VANKYEVYIGVDLFDENDPSFLAFKNATKEDKEIICKLAEKYEYEVLIRIVGD